MLEGKKHVRNDSWGPVIYAATFRDENSGQDTVVAWATKPYAYVRLNNTTAVSMTDIYGVRREVAFDAVRTRSVPVPLGESPIYITGPAGLKANPRADPGW